MKKAYHIWLAQSQKQKDCIGMYVYSPQPNKGGDDSNADNNTTPAKVFTSLNIHMVVQYLACFVYYLTYIVNFSKPPCELNIFYALTTTESRPKN